MVKLKLYQYGQQFTTACCMKVMEVSAARPDKHKVTKVKDNTPVGQLQVELEDSWTVKALYDELIEGRSIRESTDGASAIDQQSIQRIDQKSEFLDRLQEEQQDQQMDQHLRNAGIFVEPRDVKQAARRAGIFVKEGTLMVPVTIIFTNDLHGTRNLLDHYKLIKSIEAKALEKGHLVLKFDAGDWIQGTIASQPSFKKDGDVLMMRFFEALKFDAVTIGNHEFDAGVFGFLRFMDNIEARQKQKRIEAVRDRVDPTPSVPIVVSNQDHRLIKRYGRGEDQILFDEKIITREIKTANGEIVEMRIGVVGIIGDDAIKSCQQSRKNTITEPGERVDVISPADGEKGWSLGFGEEIPFAKTVEDDNTVALKERVRSLRKDKHVHLVVVLLHGGQGSSDGEINEDDLLAQKMSEWEGVIGADFIIGGHTHCVYGPGVGKKSPEEIYGPGEEPEEISQDLPLQGWATPKDRRPYMAQAGSNGKLVGESNFYLKLKPEQTEQQTKEYIEEQPEEQPEEQTEEQTEQTQATVQPQETAENATRSQNICGRLTRQSTIHSEQRLQRDPLLQRLAPPQIRDREDRRQIRQPSCKLSVNIKFEDFKLHKVADIKSQAPDLQPPQWSEGDEVEAWYKDEWYKGKIATCYQQNSLGFGAVEDEQGRFWVEFDDLDFKSWVALEDIQFDGPLEEKRDDKASQQCAGEAPQQCAGDQVDEGDCAGDKVVEGDQVEFKLKGEWFRGTIKVNDVKDPSDKYRVEGNDGTEYLVAPEDIRRIVETPQPFTPQVKQDDETPEVKTDEETPQPFTPQPQDEEIPQASKQAEGNRTQEFYRQFEDTGYHRLRRAVEVNDMQINEILRGALPRDVEIDEHGEQTDPLVRYQAKTAMVNHNQRLQHQFKYDHKLRTFPKFEHEIEMRDETRADWKVGSDVEYRFRGSTNSTSQNDWIRAKIVDQSIEWTDEENCWNLETCEYLEVEYTLNGKTRKQSLRDDIREDYNRIRVVRDKTGNTKKEWFDSTAQIVSTVKDGLNSRIVTMLKKEVERDVDRMEAEAKEGNFSPQELCEKFKEMNEGRLYVNAGNFVMEPKFKQMKELVDPDERLSTKLSGRSERMVDPDKSGRSKYPQVYQALSDFLREQRTDQTTYRDPIMEDRTLVDYEPVDVYFSAKAQITSRVSLIEQNKTYTWGDMFDAIGGISYNCGFEQPSDHRPSETWQEVERDAPEARQRKNWAISSRVEVFCFAEQRWIEGEIVQITREDECEWLTVEYEGSTFICEGCWELDARSNFCARMDPRTIRPLRSQSRQLGFEGLRNPGSEDERIEESRIQNPARCWNFRPSCGVVTFYLTKNEIQFLINAQKGISRLLDNAVPSVSQNVTWNEYVKGSFCGIITPENWDGNVGKGLSAVGKNIYHLNIEVEDRTGVYSASPRPGEQQGQTKEELYKVAMLEFAQEIAFFEYREHIASTQGMLFKRIQGLLSVPRPKDKYGRLYDLDDWGIFQKLARSQKELHGTEAQLFQSQVNSGEAMRNYEL